MKTPTDVTLATLVQAFFLERLVAQRNASRQTVAAYRDSFRLLLHFAERHLGKTPERLALTDVDAPLVLAFLDHLERDRHNTIRSRNARLAAIRSFVHFAAFKEPAALPSLQRVLAIPMKRYDKPLLGCSASCTSSCSKNSMRRLPREFSSLLQRTSGSHPNERRPSIGCIVPSSSRLTIS